MITSEVRPVRSFGNQCHDKINEHFASNGIAGHGHNTIDMKQKMITNSSRAGVWKYVPASYF